MPGTSSRGFASMDPMKQREIASKGGRAAHLKGTAHEFTPEEARMAGSKGGRAARQKRLQQIQNMQTYGGNLGQPTPIRPLVSSESSDLVTSKTSVG